MTIQTEGNTKPDNNKKTKLCVWGGVVTVMLKRKREKKKKKDRAEGCPYVVASEFGGNIWVSVIVKSLSTVVAKYC